jgi:hypothetical protein
MQKITDQQIRSSFVNASRSEAARLTLPGTLAAWTGTAWILCCGNVRVESPVNEINPDPAVVVLRQIDGLMARTELFLNRVQGR